MNTKPKILIVDDTPQNVQVLSKILYDIGYDISISTTGNHALQSLANNLPDLILLDIQMPGLNGFEVCKILKENPVYREIPVIFLTAASEPENILMGFKLGAVDYITKTFNTGELTARVATHIELKIAKEKLIEINLTKDKFFSIIAHDLINPSHQLLALSDMLKNNISRFDTAKIEQYAININNAAKQNHELLNNLLNWGRSQLNLMGTSKERIDIHTNISDVISNIKVLAESKNISIEINGEKNIFGIFNLEMFKMIIRNLITNAIKFSHAGSKVYCNITENNTNTYKISVIDTGIGIHKNDIPKLFRIDVSHSTEGTNSESGTGLGLILCKEFASKNDSDIIVESEEGKGSTFSFIIKKADSSE